MPATHHLEDELVVDFGESGRLPLQWEIDAAEQDFEWRIAQIAAEEDAEAFVNAMKPDDGYDDDPSSDTPAADTDDADDADEEYLH